MKMTTQQKQLFLTHLQQSMLDRGWTFSELARKCCINQSQVSRIAMGKFKTVSSNVSKICMEIGFDISSIGGDHELDRQRISDSAISIWNGTRGDADVVVSLLKEIAKLRGKGARRKGGRS
jgi:DNA-binding Xre family transcriptional regulator